MSEELIKRLIEFLETASPFVWQVVNKQVLVLTIQSIFWCIVTAVIAFVCAIWAKKEYAKHKEEPQDMHEIYVVFLSIGAAFALIVAFCLASEVVGYLINPDYRAIKIMLDLIK